VASSPRVACTADRSRSEERAWRPCRFDDRRHDFVQGSRIPVDVAHHFADLTPDALSCVGQCALMLRIDGVVSAVPAIAQQRFPLGKQVLQSNVEDANVSSGRCVGINDASWLGKRSSSASHRHS
jgi:hypothetical protein